MIQDLLLLLIGELTENRVAEVAREHGWHPPKSLDLDNNFKPKHTLFCRDLRTFWRSLGKKVPFWVKNSVSWARSYMVNIAYFTELILQICDYAQKRRI